MSLWEVDADQSESDLERLLDRLLSMEADRVVAYLWIGNELLHNQQVARCLASE